LLHRLRLDNTATPLLARWRIVPLVVIGVIWLASVALLIAGWSPGTYLSLELAWALLPIMIQIGFGGDILRRYARLVVLSIGGMTLYLCLADFLAIGSGTWEIDSAQSLHWLIAGVLPVEEIVFFLLTNTLITFGVVLLLAQETRVRFGEIRDAIFRRGRKA
jgi:putative membrane protein